MIGMMMSLTSELTIAPNAAPMMTPTARSTTLPRIANFLNSSSIGHPSAWVDRRLPAERRLLLARRSAAASKFGATLSVDQAGMHHGFTHCGLGLLACRHHGQPHVRRALADQRQRIFDRSRRGLDKEIDVKRRELVLKF